MTATVLRDIAHTFGVGSQFELLLTIESARSRSIVGLSRPEIDFGDSQQPALAGPTGPLEEAIQIGLEDL